MMLGTASGIIWFPEISFALAMALSIPPVSKDTVEFCRRYPVGILWVTAITDVAERPGRGGGAWGRPASHGDAHAGRRGC
jgi:hypothetical protein